MPKTTLTQSCSFCNKQFERLIAEAKRVKTPFCSMHCYNKSRNAYNAIKYVVDPNGCWICTSHKPDKAGYFVLSVNGRDTKMHRFMYEKNIGPIPEGLLLRHKCDVPGCINPDHLEPGTHKDNNHDKIIRGRLPNQKGERSKHSKISDYDALIIKQTIADIINYFKDTYDLDYKTVFDIVHNKTWKHVNAGGKRTKVPTIIDNLIV